MVSLVSDRTLKPSFFFPSETTKENFMKKKPAKYTVTLSTLFDSIKNYS